MITWSRNLSDLARRADWLKTFTPYSHLYRASRILRPQGQSRELEARLYPSLKRTLRGRHFHCHLPGRL
jgi:hypothetical protein